MGEPNNTCTGRGRLSDTAASVLMPRPLQTSDRRWLGRSRYNTGEHRCSLFSIEYCLFWDMLYRVLSKNRLAASAIIHILSCLCFFLILASLIYSFQIVISLYLVDLLAVLVDRFPTFPEISTENNHFSILLLFDLSGWDTRTTVPTQGDKTIFTQLKPSIFVSIISFYTVY